MNITWLSLSPLEGYLCTRKRDGQVLCTMLCDDRCMCIPLLVSTIARLAMGSGAYPQQADSFLHHSEVQCCKRLYLLHANLQLNACAVPYLLSRQDHIHSLSTACFFLVKTSGASSSSSLS